MKACYAITSFCLEIAQQFGKPFIYDLWQYENDTRDLLSLSSSERLLAKELSTSPSVAGMNSYATVLDKMDVISTRMVSNNIFVKERYCDPPPLSLSTIRDARLDVSKALSFSNAISGIDARAAQFSENAKKYSKNQTITNLALPLATQDKTAANSTPEIIANESKSGIAIPQIPKPDSAIVLLPLGAFCGSIAIAGLVAAVFYFKQKGRL